MNDQTSGRIASASPSGAQFQVLRKLMANASWLFAGNSFGVALGVIQGLVVARFLGVESFGIFALISSLTASINQIVDSRVWETVVKYVHKFKEQGRSDKAVALIKMCLLIDLCSALIGSTILFLIADRAAEVLMQTSAYSKHLMFFGLTILAAFPTGTCTALLRVDERFRGLAFKESLIALIRMMAVLIALFYTTEPLLGIVFAYVFCACVDSMVSVGMSRRTWVSLGLTSFRSSRFTLLRGHRREILRFLIYSNLIAFTKLIQQQTGTLMTGYWLGPAAVGWYRAAKRFADLMLIPLSPLTVAIYPEFTRLWHEKKYSLLKSTFVRISLGFAALGVSVGMAMAFAAKTIFTLALGPEYDESIPVYYLLVLGSTLQAGFLLIPQLLRAMGRIGSTFLGNVLCTIAYAVTLAMTLPYYGLIGVGFAYLALSVVWIGISITTMHAAWKQFPGRIT